MQATARARLASALIALGVATAGCDHGRPTGNVSLIVTVSGDVPVAEVGYQLTGMGDPETAGSMRAAEPSTMFSKLISHIPTSDGYLVQATAKSVDGQMECAGMAGAEVRPNATTVVQIQLGCHGAGAGQVHISIGVECPWFQVASYSVSPLSASVGEQIAVSETTSDTDGAPISFQWSAPTGAFQSPTDSATMYTCTEPGSVALTAGAATGPCQASRMIVVTCVGDAGAD